MKLTKNFSLEELIHTQRQVTNKPNIDQIANLRELCINILQPARDGIGTWIQVNSGFRSVALNKLVGGATNSQHLRGMAADIISPDNKKLIDFIFNNLQFDQLIWEFGTAKCPQWVHVSYVKEKNRNYFLHSYRTKNGIIYSKHEAVQA